VELRAPRVNDRRRDEQGQRQRFTSHILPPYMRRSPKVAEVLPILYCDRCVIGPAPPNQRR
jgi:putative transposase